MLTCRQLTGLTVAAAGLVPAAILVQLLADVLRPETVLRVARSGTTLRAALPCE